jgi:outer membrane usher protein
VVAEVAALLLAAALPSDGAALLLLYLNEVEQGPARVLFRPGDVLVPEEELRGVRVDKGRVEIDGRNYVSLRGAGMAFRYAESDLSLHVRVDAALLPVSRIDAGASARPADLVVSRGASAFLNYAVEAPSAALSFEPGLTVGPALLLGSVSRDGSGAWTRGPTSLSLDDAANLRRWSAGDTFFFVPGAQGDLAGSVELGGAAVARDFALDPWLVTSALPSTRGEARTPSTLEVYVNGALVRQERLPPGPYEVRNLPASEGAGAVRAVVRDAFGRSEEVSSSYYFTTHTLARGFTDYAYAAGLRRLQGYGGPLLLGRHRVGLTDSITASAHLEAMSGGASAGLGAALRLPFGAMELALALSRQDGEQGAAAALGASFAGSVGHLGVRARAMSPRFSNASLGPIDDRAALRIDATASPAFVGPLGIAALWSFSLTHGEAAQQIGGQASLPLFQRGSAVLQAHGGTNGFSALALLVWTLGERTSAQAGAQWQGNATASAGVQRSLPLDAGVGYRLQAAQGALDAAVEAQAAHGRWTASYRRFGQESMATAGASGALVLIGGKAFLGRPVDQSFALVRVPGVAGVRAFLENQEIGRTDGDGDVLVPGLPPFLGNRLGIAGVDLPTRFDVSRSEQLVSAPRRGGALVQFPVRSLHPVSGKARFRGDGTPAFGTLTVSRGAVRAESPIGRGGEFFFEDLAPGSYQARIESPAGACGFTLLVPVESEIICGAER